MNYGYDHDHPWVDDHMDGYSGGGMHGDMGWAGWLVMGSVLLIGLAVLVALIFWLVRTTSQSTGERGAALRSSASGLLDDRFARGEIDEEEYVQRRVTLQGIVRD